MRERRTSRTSAASVGFLGGMAAADVAEENGSGITIEELAVFGLSG